MILTIQVIRGWCKGLLFCLDKCHIPPRHQIVRFDSLFEPLGPCLKLDTILPFKARVAWFHLNQLRATHGTYWVQDGDDVYNIEDYVQLNPAYIQSSFVGHF